MASIIKPCDCLEWDDCPHPWVVRYRTDGGRSSRQREQSFGDDVASAPGKPSARGRQEAC